MDIRPSVGWIWGGVGLIVLSFVAFFALLAPRAQEIQDTVGDLAVLEPGTVAEVELDVGTYGLVTDDMSSVDVTVTGPAGSVPLSQASDGSDIIELDVDQVGTYRIANDGPERVAIINENLVEVIGKAFGTPLLVGTILGLAGIAMIISTAIRRSRARRAMMQASYYPPPPAPTGDASSPPPPSPSASSGADVSPSDN